MLTPPGAVSVRAISDVVPELAKRMLVSEPPPIRMPTVRQLASEHGSSLASIHTAIGRLEESGAIVVERRGRLGAFLVARSVGRLWAAAENGPLVVSLPLASSLRYEALATAIKQLLVRAGLEVFLIFVRGSRQRLQAAREGRCHLALMSSFAASQLCEPRDAIVLELGPNSYNTGHRVFYPTSRGGQQPVRVIVDRHSADQQLLTALEFGGIEVQLVPAMTAQITRLLTNGQADAAVWTADEMEATRLGGIHDRPLSPAVRANLGDRDTRAALVCRSEGADVLRAVTASIEPAAFAALQAAVMAGEVVPEY
ncbi:MAG TPA: YhfZ family protein [Candidatus Limnocylindria bacterium]|nr:YhfZ family protein [Candidatus Limnocylindria bacterium]